MFEGDNNEMVCGVYCDVDDIFFHENVNIFRRRVEFQWMKSVCGVAHLGSILNKNLVTDNTFMCIK